MVMKDNRKSKSSVSILTRTLTFPYPSPLIRLVLLYLLVLYFTSKIDIKGLIGLHVFEFSVGFAWDLLSYEKENQTNLYLSFSQSSFYQSFYMNRHVKTAQKALSETHLCLQEFCAEFFFFA